MNRRDDRFSTREVFRASLDTLSIAAQAGRTLETSAHTLGENAGATAKRVADALGAATSAAFDVQSGAAATEEMCQAIADIGRQAERSAAVSADAMGATREISAAVDDLSARASDIDEVVQLISAIAGQTNLLALNATIEAARAGDAGRGFAIVAQEVKALASQTAGATTGIAEQLTNIREAAQRNTTAVRDMFARMTEVTEIATAIAAAVTEQSAATAEIAKSVGSASRRTTSISEDLALVDRMADEAAGAAGEVTKARMVMAERLAQLEGDIEAFLNTARAA